MSSDEGRDGDARGVAPCDGAARDGARRGDARRGVRHRALALMSLALAFYFGFIIITIYRSHH